MTTPDAYVAAVPDGRREMVEAIRAVINAHKPAEVEECIQYGMLGWAVPHAVYPDGYHCDAKQPVPYVQLANRKGNVALYLFCMVVEDGLVDWFRAELKARGKRVDMGKSCVRFKTMDDIPLDLIGETLQRMPLGAFLERYTAQIPPSAKRRRG